MNVQPILNRFLLNVTPSMHKVRRASLSACLDSLLNGAHASITSIGRSIHRNAKEKHRIKQADRLCGNQHLYQERIAIYHALCHYWVAPGSHPIVLVDWSDLDSRGDLFLLRASRIFEGRAITLFEQVHSNKTKEKPQTHKAFLHQFSQLLPEDCHPIIVTDAGFKVPWFQLVLDCGWDYVGRVRQPNSYRERDTDQWYPIVSLYQSATKQPKMMNTHLTKVHEHPTTLVSYRSTPKGRNQLTKKGQIAQNGKSKKHSKGATDPWVLATSLKGKHKLAKRIVSIYQTRMQIEEGFRDMKSERFGMGFNVNNSRMMHRVAILVLLTTLASMILLIVGMVTTIKGLAKDYQANTIKKRNVLSLSFLGKRAIADKSLKIPISDWVKAAQVLKQRISYEVS